MKSLSSISESEFIQLQFLFKNLGEFQLRLRHLEKNLLQVLNEAKGRILDDDTVISSLETLKEEAAEVSKKVEETDEVMKEIEMTSQQYMVRCI